MRPPQQWHKIRLIVGLSGICSAWSSGFAGSNLPVPCAAGACGAKGPSQFVTAGAATAVATQNAMTINQTTNSAILNWSSFDIARNGSVTFKQPGASSIALNRIFQGSPSQILGNLSANGQVYLLNLNGFLFGPNSTINTGGLLVSSLPLSLSDDKFKNGILSPLLAGQPAFDATLDPLAMGTGRSSVLDVNGQPLLDSNNKPINVQILVQPGAQINATNQGRILLAGQSVTNGGTLSAPDGQVILAAGTKVYLQADTDPGLRGLVVEVDGNQPDNKAWNQLSGILSAPRGNIWMVGLAVNQDGRISASTSVAANGSIRLEAAGGAQPGGGNLTVASTQGGALTIGPQSRMEITTDSSGGTAVAAQTQLPSSITLLGEQVLLQGGSIVAPGATLTAIGAANPSQAAEPSRGARDGTAPFTVAGVTGTPDPKARVRVDAGTTIDLSGSTAELPITANLVQAQLRSSELADDPTQRNGALRGQTVYIDARNAPNTAFANLKGEIDAVPQTIEQRTAAGGHAIFQSEGDAVFANGASLNMSGGAVNYAGGVLQTTYLVGANGQLYPIASADPLLTYVGVVNPTFTRTFNTWGVQDIVPTPGLSSYQPGYVQGAAAGSVQFAAPTLVLQGALQGNAVNGIYQRTPATAVSGGHLTIGMPLGVQVSGPADYLSSAIRLTPAPTTIAVDDNAALPRGLALDLPTAFLTDSGFTSTRIYSNSSVTLPGNTPLALPGGSELVVIASRIDVLSGITDPGGSLSFQSDFNVGTNGSAQRVGVYVGDGVSLDVRGLWTNDQAAGGSPASLTSQNGGSIALGASSTSGLVSLGNDVTLHASGGAWQQSNGAIVSGSGGSIAINDGAIGGGIALGNNLAIDGFGVNGAAGGKFTLSAPRLEIGAPATALSGWTVAQTVDEASAAKQGEVLQVFPRLFSDYGFQSVNLAAVGFVADKAATTNVLSVDPGTRIDARVRTLQLSPTSALAGSAPNVAGVASSTLLLPYQQRAEAIALSAVPLTGGNGTGPNGGTALGDLSIGSGAELTTAAGGSITITGSNSVVEEGVLRAPAGSVTLQVLQPNADYDIGFIPGQRIELGSTGVIDVSGAFVSQPTSTGLSLGKLSPGGTANLFADRGAVVTDAGSVISVAGTTATLDVLQPDGSYAHEAAASAGGAVNVHSGESISLLGGIAAAAGTNGSTGPAAAGSLDVELTRAESWWGVATQAANATFNQGPLVIELDPSLSSTSPSPAASNQAVLGAAQLASSGLDALRLEAGGALRLTGRFSLVLDRAMTLDAPVVTLNPAANVLLSAPYLELDNRVQSVQTAPPNANTARGGSGSVIFNGAEIDLLGSTVFQGTSDVRFTSSGDLLLRGLASSASATSLAGALTVAGDLTLDAARIYPTTATSFTISALPDPLLDKAGSVTIGKSGADPGAPLSAAGTLSVSAAAITSNGALYAPFGSISLTATDTLTLADGSVTSVSGTGLTVPYGTTSFGGQQWNYTYLNVPQTIAAIPDRHVSLTAPTVTLAKRATIDLSGGGDLSAYEWVPGPGGSTDALAPGSVAGLYAILPSTRGVAAPRDAQDSDPAIAAGETLYWSGGGGLAAGFYPVLPARYALVPGAVLIKAAPGFQSTNPGLLGALTDGTPVFSGFLSYGETGLHLTPGYSGYAIYPGSYGSKLAGYNVSDASAFFPRVASAAGAPRPAQPADAGSLSLSVLTSLDAFGQVKSAAGTGGIAAPIEISAADLVVGTAGASAPADAVVISGDVLDSWHPGSLLIGGTSSARTAATAANPKSETINVTANTVTVSAGTTLSADEIVLVANQTVEVQGGAGLRSSATASPKEVPAGELVTLKGANTNPGLLAVSDLNWLIPQRAATVPSAASATVAVDAGASVGSLSSLTFDALGQLSLAGTLSGQGAAWSIGSSGIALAPTGSSTDPASLDAATLNSLAAARAVRLASTGSIDVLAPVALGVGADGSPSFESLTLQAAGFNNLTGGGAGGAASTTQLGAKLITIQGPAAAGAGVAALAGPAGSRLELVGDELDLGPGFTNVNGFAVTNAAIGGPVVGRGRGGLAVGGDLTIGADGLTADTAAATLLSATGKLSIAGATGAAAPPRSLGGSLTLLGDSIDVAGTVTAPAGVIQLTAAHDIDLQSTGLISASGTVVGIGNQAASSPGGRVSLTAGNNITLHPGSMLDVSGTGAGAAGALALSAGNTVQAGATLNGRGGSGAAGGSFALDAGSLAALDGSGGNPLSVLASALGASSASAGGFSRAIDLRVRTGDLVLDAGQTLSANAVSVTTDAGKLLIAGTIAAPPAALRGNLALFGGAGVELAAGAELSADGGSGRAGQIDIGAGRLVADGSGLLSAYSDAAILLDAGSRISASGAAESGSLLLRAPALLNAGDIAVSSAADVSRVGHVVVEPLLVFNTAGAGFSSASAPTTADFQNLGQTVAGYMNAAAPAIAARLAPTINAPLRVEAGVELVAPGALTLPGLDLSAQGLNWHFGNAPVDLTVRAAGSIEVAGTISDGFNVQTVGDNGAGVLQPTLMSGPSASLRLVAGADTASANPLAVVPVPAAPNAGDLKIDPGVVVRTGTGDINLAASRNIVLAGAGSGAYTAGTPAIEPGGSPAVPYPSVDFNVGTTAPTIQDNNGNPIDYGVFVPGTSLLTSLPNGGGSLSVRAGGDISNLSTTSPGAVTLWQLRTNRTTASTPFYGVNLAAYDWNFGTLGGGDLRIAAGGAATNISAAAADSLLSQASGAAPLYLRGGGLSFAAGGDIGSAQIFVADGVGTVTAGGALTATQNSVRAADPKIGSAFYLQSSAINVTARLGAVMDGAFNPTALQQVEDGIPSLPESLNGSYYTYNDQSALSILSIAGAIKLGTGSSAVQTILGTSLNERNGSSGTRNVYPASLSLAALAGDIVFQPAIGSFTLFPSPIGQIDLLAAGDVIGNNSGGGRIVLADAPPDSVATPNSVAGPSILTALALSPKFSGNIHAGDASPALVTAGGKIQDLFLVIPKAARIVAGSDINNLTYTGQNLNPLDETIFSAGHDFSYLDSYAGSGAAVGGPGRFDILAGRNIALGLSPGIVTTGNLSNPNLPTSQGADLTLYTGLGTTPDFAGFRTKIIDPSSIYKSELVSYVESIQGGSGLTFSAAEAAFQNFTTEQQRPLIDDVFFSELALSGNAANTVPGAGFKQGYAAIDALFPGSRSGIPGSVPGAFGGDLTLEFSRIYTLSGGNITLVVPGGGIDVGLANPPDKIGKKPASQLGIVAQGPGDVRIYAKNDVNVNSSRIFTLGGGNILIWSDEGSIDAGLGAKTSVSAPPPSILIGSDGTVTVDFSGAAQGSGIRTIQTLPTTPAGNVDLIAPVGSVNAGDAGIGAAGNINIAAQSVIGVSNINFGGSATGVPAQVSSISASLSGASNAAAGATNASTNAVSGDSADKDAASPLAQTALSWLDVFVTGLGEENCKTDDIECLKRQKTPAR